MQEKTGTAPKIRYLIEPFNPWLGSESLTPKVNKYTLLSGAVAGLGTAWLVGNYFFDETRAEQAAEISNEIQHYDMMGEEKGYESLVETCDTLQVPGIDKIFTNGQDVTISEKIIQLNAATYAESHPAWSSFDTGQDITKTAGIGLGTALLITYGLRKGYKKYIAD